CSPYIGVNTSFTLNTGTHYSCICFILQPNTPACVLPESRKSRNRMSEHIKEESDGSRRRRNTGECGRASEDISAHGFLHCFPFLSTLFCLYHLLSPLFVCGHYR